MLYKTLPKIMQKTSSLEVHYPQAHHFQDLQQNGFWTANEVNLEKDIQPLLTELTDSDKHGILTVLKLFTSYETRADEYWGDVIKNLFPRPEIQELAALNSAVELSVHRRVYDKLNKLLHVSNDEYYESYKQSPSMSARMDFLDSYLTSGSPLEQVAAFCFAEGAVLFSSFAFLMSFRANGNNKLPNIGLAIKFSARDEDCVDQETEVLTAGGWKLLKDFDIDNDKVLQFDQETSEVSFTKASRKIEKQFTGEMVSFKTDKGNFDQLLTPNHRYIQRSANSTGYTAREAKDFKPHQYNYTPLAGNTSATYKEFSAYDALTVAIQADGSVSSRYDGSLCGTIPITFTLSKQRKIDRLEGLLHTLNLRYSKSEKKIDNLNVKDQFIYRIDLPIDLFPVEHLKSFQWVPLDAVDKQWCDAFFAELVEWDGCKMENSNANYHYYSSTWPENVDVVQALGSLSGRHVVRSIQRDSRKDVYKDIHRAYIHRKQEKANGNIKKGYVDYDGMVYCLTVPKGAFVMRRNGCVSVTGNCHNQAASWLFKTLESELKELGEDVDLTNQLKLMADTVRQHEYEIIDEIFSKGTIEGITATQLKHFLDSRLNVVLQRLGYGKLYEVKYNPIATWFDKIVESYQYVDFFAGQGSSYSRGWDVEGFAWRKKVDG